MSRPKKHSLTLNGPRTRGSLEEEFWRAVRGIAEARGLPVNVLAAAREAERGPDTGLATAIRLYVLKDILTRLPPR